MAEDREALPLAWQCLCCKHQEPIGEHDKSGNLASSASDDSNHCFLHDLEGTHGVKSGEAVHRGRGGDGESDESSDAAGRVSSSSSSATSRTPASTRKNSRLILRERQEVHTWQDENTTSNSSNVVEETTPAEAMKASPTVGCNVVDATPEERNNIRKARVIYFYDSVNPELANAPDKKESSTQNATTSHTTHQSTAPVTDNTISSSTTAAEEEAQPLGTVTPSPLLAEAGTACLAVGKHAKRYCERCGDVTSAELVEMAEARRPPSSSVLAANGAQKKAPSHDGEADVVLEELPDMDPSDGAADGQGNGMPGSSASSLCGSADSSNGHNGFMRYGRWLADSLFTCATEDKATREYNTELVLSIFPAFLVTLWHWRVVQALWRCLLLLLHPLSPRMHTFDEPLRPREAERKTRVWMAKREGTIGPEEMARDHDEEADTFGERDSVDMGNDLANYMAGEFASFM